MTEYDDDLRSRNTRPGRAEAGSALLVAVLLLVFMGMIGLAAMDTVSRDRQVAGFTKRTRIGFYAAEAGIHTGLNLVRSQPNRLDPPTLPTVSLGNAADYPETTQPQFEADPNITDPAIRVTHSSFEYAVRKMGMGMGGGTQGPVVDYWVINSMGTGPNGGTARLEASKRILSSSGYSGG